MRGAIYDSSQSSAVFGAQIWIVYNACRWTKQNKNTELERASYTSGMESKLDHQVSFLTHLRKFLVTALYMFATTFLPGKSHLYLAMQSTSLNARVTSKLATNMSIIIMISNLFFGANISYAIIKDSSRMMGRSYIKPF